jgi:hypothetical protein
VNIILNMIFIYMYFHTLITITMPNGYSPKNLTVSS